MGNQTKNEGTSQPSITIFDDLVAPFPYEKEYENISEMADLLEKFESGEIDYTRHTSPPDMSAVSFKGATLENFFRSMGIFGRGVLLLIKILSGGIVIASALDLLMATSWFVDLIYYVSIRWPSIVPLAIDPIVGMLSDWESLKRMLFGERFDFLDEKYADVLMNVMAVVGVICVSILAIVRARLVRGFVFFNRFRPFQKQLREKLEEARTHDAQSVGGMFKAINEILPAYVEMYKTMKSWQDWNVIYEQRLKQSVRRQLILSLVFFFVIFASDVAYVSFGGKICGGASLGVFCFF